MIRILVADDQGLMLEGLRSILELEEDFQVVGMAKTGEEALRCCEAIQPDVVVMDVAMPSAADVNVIATMKSNYPGMKVLGLSSHSDDASILATLQAGADGYLLKDSPSEELVKAIRVVMASGVVLAPAVAKRVVEHLQRFLEREEQLPESEILLSEELTNREMDVLRLVAQGLSNREIADRLFITEGTVKNHVSSVCRKLDVRDRTQIAIFAWRHRLVGNPASAIMQRGCCRDQMA